MAWQESFQELESQVVGPGVEGHADSHAGELLGREHG